VSKESEKTMLRGARYTAIATQIPFTVMAGYGLGYGLDYLFGTTWLRNLFLILAIVGALTGLVLQVLKDQKSK
jgi:Kef-type K+ transport system membrane component KefB